MLLAVVQMACRVPITFAFRLPLNRHHRASGWSEHPTVRSPSELLSPLRRPAGSSMTRAQEYAIVLGTMLSMGVTCLKKVSYPILSYHFMILMSIYEALCS